MTRKPSRRSFCPADELPTDDTAAVRQLTGQHRAPTIHSQASRSVLVGRRCPPWALRDREMTLRYIRAVRSHRPQAEKVAERERELAGEIHELLQAGELKAEDITEDLVLKMLLAKTMDTRSPTVQLKAAETLAEIKGLKKRSELSGDKTDAYLQGRLDELRQQQGLQRTPRRKGTPAE